MTGYIWYDETDGTVFQGEVFDTEEAAQEWLGQQLDAEDSPETFALKQISEVEREVEA